MIRLLGLFVLIAGYVVARRGSDPETVDANLGRGMVIGAVGLAMIIGGAWL